MQVTVILGHNGAGKSTMYAMICGTTSVTKGKITVLEEQLLNNFCGRRFALGYCPQANCIFDALTVKDHLRLFSILKKTKGEWKEVANSICSQLNIDDLMHKRAGELSGGEKRKLCLAMAFIGGDKLVLLDEPTAGLDVHARFLAKKLIVHEKYARAIVLTTHYLDEAEVMADWMYIMHVGRVVCSGTPYFIKKRFAPGILLEVVFEPNVSREGVDAAVKIITQQVENVQIRATSRRQIRLEIPKSQQERLIGLFESLESKEKELQIDGFGLSTNAFEEAFLRIGEKKDHTQQESQEIREYLRCAKTHEDTFARPLQRAKYIWLKKCWETIYNIPLTIDQVKSSFVKLTQQRTQTHICS